MLNAIDQAEKFLKVAGEFSLGDLPTEQPHLYETSGLGVAVGLKLHSDFTAAVAAMSRVGQVFVPDPAHVQTYEQLYRRVYCRMYQRLQPLYHDIAAITGDDAG